MPNPESTEVIEKIAANFSYYDFAKDFAGPIVTVLVAIFTVWYAFTQIRIQHGNSIKAQKEEAKRKTRIETFKELDALLNSSSTVIRKVNTYYMVQKYSTSSVDAQQAVGTEIVLTQELNQALLSVISKIESLEIIDQLLFRVFRYSAQSVVHDILHLHEIKDRNQKTDSLIEFTNTALDYFSDFQKCLQNMAYKDIFDSSVQHRVPPDQRRKVITNEPNELKKLEDYFLKETAWGKEIQKWEKYADEKYGS